MIERLDLVSKIDFSKATVGRYGVIIKAACLSSVQTEAGLGVGGTDDSLCNYNANGVAKTATGNFGSGMHFAIPAAYRDRIPHSGTLQFELCKADALSAITNNGISGNTWFKMWDTTTTNGAPFMKPDFVAANATTGYRAETEGKGTNINASGLAVGIQPNSTWANTDTSEYIMTSNSVCDVDGTHITFGMSWDAMWCNYFIGGVFCGRHRRKQCIQAPTEILFSDSFGIRIRNLILSTSKLVIPDTIPGIPRVALVMHSFGNHVNGYSNWDSAKGFWTEDAGGTSTAPTYSFPEGIQPTIRANVNNPVKLLNVSKSSQSTSWAKTLAEATLASTDTNRRIDRFRPHIVVLCFRTNEANTSGGVTGMKSNITAVNTALRAKGIVPIWVNEQNGNLLSATYDHSIIQSGATESLYTAMGTQVAADKIALVMDIGYCDAYAVTGGASVNPIYVENNSGALHLNMVAGAIYGGLIAAEINRLVANPPAYAWWK